VKFLRAVQIPIEDVDRIIAKGKMQALEPKTVNGWSTSKPVRPNMGQIEI